MEANPAQMRQIGNALITIGEEIGTDAESAQSDANTAGTGNDGLTVVAAAAQTSETWIAHVTDIGNNIISHGGGLIAAANNIEGVDIDSSRNMGMVPF